MSKEFCRIIGIRHRVKKTSEGDARPTQVCVSEGEKRTFFNLKTIKEELDWVLGKFPITHRAVEATDDLSDFFLRHIKWRKLKKGETVPEGMEHLVSKKQVAVKIPILFDGFRTGDTALMILGGSGDQLAVAIANQALEIGAEILRVPAAKLAHFRGEVDGDKDSSNIIDLYNAFPDWFYPVESKDRQLEAIRKVYREWRLRLQEFL